MDYIIVTQGPAYPLSPTAFATESAFAEHLRELRKAGGAHFSRLVLVAPQMEEAAYAAQKHHLGVVRLETDEVLFIPSHPMSVSTGKFWLKHARPLWRRMRDILPNASIVHADMSTDVRRPATLIAALAARQAGRPVLFVVDIDFRMHAKRFYRLGYWGLKKYLFNRLVQEPLKMFQVWLAVRAFQLVLLKSPSMVKDFGRGRGHVKNFYDTVHAEGQLMPADQIQARLAWLRETSRPLQLCYFGRLVANKGIDRMVEAVDLARRTGCDARLTIIGEGPAKASLEQQVIDARLADVIQFLPQVAYGEPLFDQLRSAHLSLAAPLIEDTPRAAFDSMARALPILAFDISYFRDLAEAGNAVILAAWPSAAALAEQIVKADRSRDLLADKALSGLDFARENTQQTWLDRRMAWTLDFALVPASRDIR